MSLAAGQIVDEDDLSVLTDIAGVWTPYTPTFTATSGTPNPGSTGYVQGRYKLVDKTCYVSLKVLLGGTGIVTGTGAWFFSLPFTAESGDPISRVGAAYCRDASAGSSGHFPAIVVCDPGTSTTVVSLFNVTAQVGAAFPFTWATGDHLSWTLTYEIA